MHLYVVNVKNRCTLSILIRHQMPLGHKTPCRITPGVICHLDNIQLWQVTPGGIYCQTLVAYCYTNPLIALFDMGI